MVIIQIIEILNPEKNSILVKFLDAMENIKSIYGKHFFDKKCRLGNFKQRINILPFVGIFSRSHVVTDKAEIVCREEMKK